jgi:transposase
VRHLRELLMLKRVPESWIPPDHILDLRARVSCGTRSEQRGEWQQRIQATLYHHGCSQRRRPIVGDGRDWLGAEPLPAVARERVTAALAMIDPLDRHMRPIEHAHVDGPEDRAAATLPPAGSPDQTS